MNVNNNNDIKTKITEEVIQQCKSKVFLHGYNQLNNFQKDVLKECIEKQCGGMSLPMGSGKTLISILLGLYLRREEFDARVRDARVRDARVRELRSKRTEGSNATESNEIRKKDGQEPIDIKLYPILVVVAKNLVSSWEHEIEKFFGNRLKYQVLHKDAIRGRIEEWKLDSSTRIVITTPETIAKYYKEHNIGARFIDIVAINEDNPNFGFKHSYIRPHHPFLRHSMGGGILFSVEWCCYIVDEVQSYTRISTQRCQGLAAICSPYRWALSGTIFNEPHPERVLGYYLILDWDDIPRDLPNLEKFIRSYNFKGLNETLVIREKNDAYKPPPVNEVIVSHELSLEEAEVYMSMKETLKQLQADIHAMRRQGDNQEMVKRFNSYRMAMITYLRQSLVCPLLPITTIAINMADFKEERSYLSRLLMKQFKNLNLDDWLDNEEAARSSRIRSVLQRLENHKNDRVVLFSCFRTSIVMLDHYISGRPVFFLLPTMNMTKRGEVIKQFEETSNGILMLTYAVGSEGLNLQCSNTAMLLDFWWNAGMTRQAIARVLRMGQEAETVNIYYFTSNTGIENSLFQKQDTKLDIINELRVGTQTTKIKKLGMDDIIQLINTNDNIQILNQINTK